MNKIIIGLLLSAITLSSGCASHYTLKNPNEKILKKEKKVFETQTFENKNQKIQVTYTGNQLNMFSDLTFDIKIKNKSKKLLKIKSEDMRISFNNFWFDVVDYSVVNKDRNIEFENESNFKVVHEIMPSKETEFKIRFKTPISNEYYTGKTVELEIFTTMGLANFRYELKKIR